MDPTLLDQGYVILPAAVPLSRLREPCCRIRETLDRGFDDPYRVLPYWTSWFPPVGTYAALLTAAGPLHPSLQARVEGLLGTEVQIVSEQVSVRLPEWSAPCELSPHRDDGAGVAFQWTVGVFLTAADRPWTGNLAVWPKGQTAPEQLVMQAGDAALFEAALLHAPVPNLGSPEHFRMRLAVYFRLVEKR